MHNQTIEYIVDGKKFRGYASHDPNISSKRPGVIVAHAWKGQDDFARNKAEELARLGYIGFATDVYGDGKEVDTNERATEMMIPLFTDRLVLRKRIIAGYEALKKIPEVDPNRISAIGFCFGGLTVIELLRSGAQLKAAVSFHGLLGYTMGNITAKKETPAAKINGSLLLLHGHDDPLVSPQDISNIQKEFTDANVDWQMDIYSHTSHAFTNPSANEPDHGLLYQPKSASRAWQSMVNFLNETFTL